MENDDAGLCTDNYDTEPHVSMSHGVKFKSTRHMSQYAYNSNLAVAFWKAMYLNGVVVGLNRYMTFPPERGGKQAFFGSGNL